MSAELLDIYSFEGELVGQMEKKEFHNTIREEYKEKSSTSIRHKHVRIFLMTSRGRIILQRRSKWKGDNQGLWDKTIGGHVTSGDSFELTALKECAEELGIPATIVRPEDFENTVATTELGILAILKPLSLLDNYQSHRIHNGEKWIETGISQFYIGYYDGAIRFIDSECCGLQVFNLEELEDEMQQYPENFTDDIKYIINKFKGLIKPVEIKKEHTLSD
ncbi:MAG: NUDIX hydrolase [Patescibacteria group bacterium]|jgi:isopentenyldiphosphate isomerase